jgi:hypothetical protein
MADGVTFLGGPLELSAWNARRISPYLNDSSVNCAARSECRGSAKDVLVPSGRRLNRTAVAHDSDQRDHSPERKIDVVNLLVGLMQHGAPFQRYSSQMRLQEQKVVRRQCSQAAIELAHIALAKAMRGNVIPAGE